MAKVDYADVVCELRQKAREINQAADVLESMIQGVGITRGSVLPPCGIDCVAGCERGHKTQAECLANGRRWAPGK